MAKRLRSSSRNSNFLFGFLFLTLGLTAFGQAPNAFNYQALTRDAAGKIIANKAIQLRASIVMGSATGTVEYAETQSATTDDQGVFTLELGHGTPVTGSFSQINWSLGTKWLKIEMDAQGGTNYSLVGAS